MSQQPERSVVYTEPVWMMEKTDRGMFSYNAELNKDGAMPKAESVFKIFSKTFGSSQMGYTACMFTAVVSQSQMNHNVLSHNKQDNGSCPSFTGSYGMA